MESATILTPRSTGLSGILLSLESNIPGGPEYEQVAQWATIAHLGASIMFGDTIIYDAQRQVTLNLKQ